MNTDFFLDAPSPFVLLDAARAMDSPPGLTAWRRCEGVPFWQVLEAAAQAAALQQRVARDFSCHAFIPLQKISPDSFAARLRFPC